MEKQKEMAIDRLAEITADEFPTVGERFDSLQATMREGFGIVLDELRGLRDDVKQTRAGSTVDYAMLKGKIEALEEDMKRVKEKVKL
jgi:hypothetical protein